MMSGDIALGVQPPPDDRLAEHGQVANEAAVAEAEQPNEGALTNIGIPVESLGGIKLLPDHKAQCVCGRTINRSSIYRHAIAGDGHCSGGSPLTEQDISAMREITFQAKASYMRNYREKTVRDRRVRGGGVTAGLRQRISSPLDGQLASPIRKAGASDMRRSSSSVANLTQDQSGIMATSLIDEPEEETAKCPAVDCGRTVRARNLLEHVSSKNCKGGHLLSASQLSEIKAIAKASRTKYNSARKSQLAYSIDVGESFGSGALALLGGEPQLPMFISSRGGQTPIATGSIPDPCVSIPSVLDMSIREIGLVMARVVCRGHGEEEKKKLEAEIVAGVESYRLTALVLLAKKPSPETLAKSLLANRDNDGAEDGVYWAVVEFVDRVRNGELAKIMSTGNAL